ncbi:PAS domain S-box protein [Halobaculum sp. EA56]|uniref:PAS domain S-box protein n=1 Tax=Halobaculum sp. EA56 TaxID=3421648 RepID=UPI003EBC0ACB
MRELYRAMSRWSVTVLGFLFLLLTLGHVITNGDEPTIDFLEISFPFAVSLGLIVGGIWLEKTQSVDRIIRLVKWTLGGAIVGIAVNIWFIFVIALEQTPAGDPIVLTLNGAGIFMTAGILLGYYATGLEAREQQLELSEQRFRALTENSSFSVITIDAAGTIQYANEAVDDLFGYPPSELRGEPIATLMPERFRESHRAGMSRYLAEGERTLDWNSVELTGQHATGREFPVEISFGEYTVDGDTIFTGVIRDITDRKQAESDLETHTERVTQLHDIASSLSGVCTESEVYQRTVEYAADLFPCDVARVSIIADNQLVPTASSAEESLAECTPEPMPLGYGVMSYRGQEPICIADITDTRSTRTAPTEGTRETPASTPDTDEQHDAGTTEQYRALLSVPLGEYGVLQLFATETAVFDERDEELAELLATHVTTSLDRINAEATIRHERDRLEEFANILSHDLRNPLNVAQGRLEFIETEDADADHIAAIVRALDRMERLIDDMLTLAREGDAVGETEAVALRAVATQAWENVATDAASLEVEDTVQLDADASRLVQAFENLYRNAIEHGGDGVTIRVGTLENGFYIEDTGPGIPAEERDDVFESGYTTNQDGTGFGLAIVKRIVEAHGWEIEVTTGRDGGARFEVLGV